jgi:hypothetical protein
MVPMCLLRLTWPKKHIDVILDVPSPTGIPRKRRYLCGRPKTGGRVQPPGEAEEDMNIGEEHELIIAEPIEAPAKLPQEAPERREGQPVPA